MIYFDNCSTTHKKPKCVIKAINKGLTKLNYNPGRASYKNAIKANLKVFKLRETASKFFNCPEPNNIIITKSCTESLNIALQSNPIYGGHIITTIYEHNSVLRTLNYLKQKYNINYSIILPEPNGKISPESIKKHILANTYMVVVNQVSNVTGISQDIKSIGHICKEYNLIFVVDGAQSAGHKKIDMQDMNINYLAIAGHKGLFGPQGIGLLLCNNAKPQPIIFGGTGTFSNDTNQPLDIPEGLESGTMSISNILGLTAGINFTQKHFQKIQYKTSIITDYIYSELSKIKNIKIYSPKHSASVISFNILNKTSNEIATLLDSYNVETRSGLHCAPMVHNYFKTTNQGMIRIGISYFNTLSQAKKLIKIIKAISNKS